MTSAKDVPMPTHDVSEARRAQIAGIIRQHITCDASGLSPAVASVFLDGFDAAADAVLAALRADPARAAEEEIALTQPQAALLAKALEPLARADRAIGDEPGPFRFETGAGFRDLSRQDIRQAAAAHRVLAAIGALAQEKGGGDE